MDITRRFCVAGDPAALSCSAAMPVSSQWKVPALDQAGDAGVGVGAGEFHALC